jgi:hypothetical protein
MNFRREMQCCDFIQKHLGILADIGSNIEKNVSALLGANAGKDFL